MYNARFDPNNDSIIVFVWETIFIPRNCAIQSLFPEIVSWTYDMSLSVNSVNLYPILVCVHKHFMCDIYGSEEDYASDVLVYTVYIYLDSRIYAMFVSKINH